VQRIGGGGQRTCNALKPSVHDLSERVGSRAGILVYFSENISVYSLRERYNLHHLWMRRPYNSDTLLYTRFGSIPFWPALVGSRMLVNVGGMELPATLVLATDW
jgi:hypothetical protein